MGWAMSKVHSLAQRMKDLKEQIDELGKEKTKLQKEYDSIRFGELPDAMDDEGIEKISYAGIGTVYTQADINVSVKDKVSLYRWLEDEGFGDLITDYVFPQTIKAFVKEQIKKGTVMPSESLTINPITRAVIKK